MTDAQSSALLSFWVPGNTSARPEEPIALGAAATARGLRLQATDAATATVTELGAGVRQIDLRAGDAPLTLTAVVPAVDVVAWWRPGSSVPHSTVPTSWSGPVDTTALTDIPIGALLLRGDRPGLVYALDTGTARTSVRAGLVEETAEFVVMVTVHDPSPGQRIRLLLDVSGEPFARAVPAAGHWLQRDGGVRVVPGAEDAVLCTWYFAHQNVTSDAVLAQADRAAALGFGTVIVDDGWQTTSQARGYGNCGDWEVAAEKFPDPAGMVAALRARGLRTMWWIGTPFAGHRSRARSLGLPTLYGEPELDADVLDPREPAARRHLVERIADLIRHTGADGLKLDFLERFAGTGPYEPPAESPVAATALLLQEIVAGIASVGTDPLIEFREPYVHPEIGRFATMLRVGDCPLSASQNRLGIVDLRLARPGTPIHSDPIMWAEDDSAERVAHHLINALPGVPQVSMDLLRLAPEQYQALEFWLGVWSEHRDVLLHGELLPERPDLLYPLVTARDADRSFVCRYAPHAVPLPPGAWRELLIANADDSTTILLNDGPTVAVRVEVRDARGRITHRADTELPTGPASLSVPSGGLARITRAASTA